MLPESLLELCFHLITYFKYMDASDSQSTQNGEIETEKGTSAPFDQEPSKGLMKPSVDDCESWTGPHNVSSCL